MAFVLERSFEQRSADLDAEASKLHAIAEEARRRRTEWLESGWQVGPRAVTKGEVLEFFSWLKGKRDVTLTSTCAISSLETAAKDAVEFLDSVAISDCPTRMFRQAQIVVDRNMLRQRDAEMRSGQWHPDPAVQLWIEKLVAAEPSSTDTTDVFFRHLFRPEASDVVEWLRSFVRKIESLPPASLVCGPDPDPDWDDTKEGDEDEEAAKFATPTSSTTANSSAVSPATSGSRSPPPAVPPATHFREFYPHTEGMLRHHPVWRSCPSDQWETVMEGVEKFIACKTHHLLYAVSPQCATRDAHLLQCFLKLGFLQLSHLELPALPEWLMPAWTLVKAALCHMDAFKAPCDKLACIMNACQIVSTLLTYMAQELSGKEGGSEGAIGADQFVPALIYAVIHASPPRLYSNLRYIGEFSRPTVMTSECGYMFTNVLSAVAFARTARAAQLSLSHEEFEEGIHRSQATVMIPLGEAGGNLPIPIPLSRTGSTPRGSDVTPSDATFTDARLPTGCRSIAYVAADEFVASVAEIAGAPSAEWQCTPLRDAVVAEIANQPRTPWSVISSATRLQEVFAEYHSLSKCVAALVKSQLPEHRGSGSVSVGIKVHE